MDPHVEVMVDLMGKVDHMQLSDHYVVHGNLFPYLQSSMYMD
jgi:hypothetical protein